MAWRPSDEQIMNKDRYFCKHGRNIRPKSEQMWATGRFQKSEFDTMLVNMLSQVPLIQKAKKTIISISFEASRESAGSSVYLFLIPPWW